MTRLPSERDWERSAVLVPRLVARDPEMVSDGGGLPFPPAALAGPPAPLDPDDPPVSALLAYLTARSAPKPTLSARLRRAPAPTAAPASLDGWRLLARSDAEILFGRGRPPALVTVAFNHDARRRTWVHHVSSAARQLRAARDGIRASSWRPDPGHEFQPEDTALRVLVAEQTFASGQRADGRVLEPDLHITDEEIVLTFFVTPRPGHQTGSRSPETPVRVALPQPIGHRRLIDGAIAEL